MTARLWWQLRAALFAALAACSAPPQPPADVLRSIDEFQVSRSGSLFVRTLARDPAEPFVKPTFQADAPALSGEGIPKRTERDVRFTSREGGEACEARVEVFQTAYPSAAAGRAAGPFFSSFVVAGRTHEWTKVRQIITEHRLTLRRPGQTDVVYRPRPGRAGKGRLPRLERDDPISAGMARIGGPTAAPRSILVFNDNPSVIDLDEGDRIEGTSSVVAAGDELVSTRRYATYLFARCDRGGEAAIARIDWGAELTLRPGSSSAETTGSVSYPPPGITESPPSTALDEAVTNGRLEVNENAAVLFDAIR